MTEKNSVIDMLILMGFEKNYIARAFKVYEHNYGHNYNIEVITEIIVRLQQKDKKSGSNKVQQAIQKLKWKNTTYQTGKYNTLFACFAQEIFGINTHKIQMKIRSDLADYIQHKQNIQYFQNLAKKKNRIQFYEYILIKKENNQSPENYDITALCELYNVRVIVFKYSRMTKEIKPIFIRSITQHDAMDIPIILLLLNRSSRYSIIHDLNDIAHTVPSTTSLGNYYDFIIKQTKYKDIVSIVCNYWVKLEYKFKQHVPVEICNLIIKFIPKFNVRPIGLPQQRKHFIQLSKQRALMDDLNIKL